MNVSCRLRRSAAYTLVDVMIVLGILAILVVAASTYWRGQMPRSRVRDVSSRLQAQLRAARMHAMSSATPVYVRLSAPSRMLVTALDEDDDGTVESNEVARLVLSTAPHLTLSTVSTAGVFRTSGDFSCAEGYWKVTVSHAGADNAYVYVLAGGHVQATERPLD